MITAKELERTDRLVVDPVVRELKEARLCSIEIQEAIETYLLSNPMQYNEDTLRVCG